MSLNNHLWNEADVLTYCFNRMQKLRKEDPGNEVAINRYSEDMMTATLGTRVFTISTCEMLKDLIRKKLGLLRERFDTNLESEIPIYVTEAVRVAHIFWYSQDQRGETVGKKAEKVLKQLDETEKLLSMTMRAQSVMAEAKALEQNVMEREKALLERESALAEAKALLERESALAAKEKGLVTKDLIDTKDARPGNDRSETGTEVAVLSLDPRSSQGQLRSKFCDERANERASQSPILSLEPRSSQGQLRSIIFDERVLLARNPQTQKDAHPETETEGVERPRPLQAFDNGLILETSQDEVGQSRSKIFDERDQFTVLRSEPRSSIFVSPTISQRSDVGPPPITDNDMIDPKKDDTQMAECLNELNSGKMFRNPTSCHTSVDNAVPVEIGILSLAQTSISETVFDTDFPVDVLIGSPFLAQLEGTTERVQRVPEKIYDTFYKGARSSMRKDIVMVADGGIGGDVSTSTVPSWRTTLAQQIKFSVEPGHPKCWMQSKDSWKSSMPQYTGLQSASQASQYERLHQAESPSHSILQFRPEGFILPNPAKNPNRFPFERKLLEEYTRRMFAAQQLEPSTSPVASRSHAIAKPVSFKQQDACIDRGKAPFKLDRFRIVVTHMPVNKAVQLMSFTGMSIAQALQIIGRHLWCRLLQQWTICQALPCTPDETFPPGRYNYLTTSKSFKATRDQGPSSSSKLLCYWGIELAI